MFIPSVAMTVTRRRQQRLVATLLALKWLNLSIFINIFTALAAYYRQKIMQAKRRLKVLVTVDALTGLNNRRHFESDAQAHIAHFERSRWGGEEFLFLMHCRDLALTERSTEQDPRWKSG